MKRCGSCTETAILFWMLDLTRTSFRTNLINFFYNLLLKIKVILFTSDAVSLYSGDKTFMFSSNSATLDTPMIADVM